MNSIFKKVFLLIAVLFVSIKSGPINFQNSSARINLKNSSALSIASTLTLGGSIKKDSAASLLGDDSSVKIIFSDGSLETNTNSSSGSFATNTSQFSFSGSQSYKAPEYAVLDNLAISGSGNTLTGSPVFNGNVTLSSGSSITCGIKSKMNVDVVLGSGTFNLSDDLRFTDSKSFTGSGTVNLQNYKLKFGATPLSFSSAITWQNASDIDFGGKTTLSSTWTFTGDAVINGNGNVLDMTSGGTLAVSTATTLTLSDLYIKGLGGTGAITFVDTSSIVRLSNVTIELAGNVTWSTGKVYIDGPTTIITKNFTITFDTNSLLTIDGQTLQFDRLGNLAGGLSPVVSGANLTFSNGGRIREINTVSQTPGGLTISANTTLPYDLYLSEDNVLNISASCTITGNGHKIVLANKKSANIILDNNVIATFDTTLFENFASEHVTLGSGASIIFGQNSLVTTYPDTTITSSLSFGAGSSLWGRGNYFTLGSSASLISKSATGFTIKDVFIRGVNANKIKAEIDTATVTFDNATLILDANFNFTSGLLTIRNDCKIDGGYQFAYQSSQTSTIETLSNLQVLDNCILRYQPSVASKNLLYLTDTSSKLTLQNSSLSVSTTGIVLRNGTLVVKGDSKLFSDATVLAEGIFLGAGTLANDFGISLEPGAKLKLKSGYVVYDNVEV